MKNLLVSAVGDQSLHNVWIRERPEFDAYLIYYGDDDALADKYTQQVPFFERRKGTKFNMLKTVMDENESFFKNYDFVFIPDDDLYLNTKGINQIFQLAHKYDLELCQPSIVGYYDVAITLHTPASLLRFTNFVEVMCPCFNSLALEKCKETFNYSISSWGIDIWWHKIMNYPTNKFAVLDDVIAIHTRRCHGGDNYVNNVIENPWEQMNTLILEQGLSSDKIEYDRVWKEMINSYSADCYYPHIHYMVNLCETIRA